LRNGPPYGGLDFLGYFGILIMADQLDKKLRDFYATFINPDAIKTFVRERLGCKCDDEVFNQIVIGMPAIFPENNPGWDLQILVGFRLLISFVSVERLSSLDEDIISMLEAGKEVRDNHSLNRFRLVLLGHLDKELNEAYRRKAQELDDKIHVHVIKI
jgi:hypothetical protein